MTDQRELYVYAFLDEPIPAGLRGLDDAPVTSVVEDGLVAAVSPAPKGRLRPQRVRLAAHQRVLAALAADSSALPASFGLVAGSEAELRALLLEHSDALRDELDHVRGCVELEVALRWNAPSVFELLIELDPELRARRDELVALGDSAPHRLRVAIGRRVESLLAAHREAHGATVRGAIDEACAEIFEREPASESVLYAAACLVERERLADFESALERAAAFFDERFVFDLKGPFAPHHFVNLELAFAARSGV